MLYLYYPSVYDCLSYLYAEYNTGNLQYISVIIIFTGYTGIKISNNGS